MYTPGEQYNLYELLQKADEGDAEAMESLVSILPAEGYTDDDTDGEIAERQVRYLRKLAEAGRSFAYIMLGDACLKGSGTPQNPAEAIRWYEKAAESGIRFGNECIGMIYYEGKDIPCDYQKAYEYFTRDEGKKSFCTAYALGEMFRRGLYVTKDEEKAVMNYASIVNDNAPFPEMDDYYWRACYRLGIALHYGLGIERDLGKAADMFSKAKKLYEMKEENASAGDITGKEFYREWLMLNQGAGKY